MTSKEFKEEIKNNPKNVYCLVSSDAEMIDLYIGRFKEAINADCVVYGEIHGTSKLLRKVNLNVLYMPKLDESIFNRPEYIFIHTDSIDKRSSIYKKYKNNIIELDNNYIPFVVKNSSMNEAQAAEFVRKCNNDMGIIKQNLLLGLNGDDVVDYSSDIYLYVDRFITKKELPNINESPISIMALLSTNCLNLLKVQTNNCSGLNPYVIKHQMPLVGIRTNKELVNIISDCFYLDCQIKKGLISIDDVLNILKERNLYAITD